MSSDSTSPLTQSDLPGETSKRSDTSSTSRIDIDTKTIVGNEAVEVEISTLPAIQVGSSIGKYEIRTKLGVGGMGAVFLAFDPLIEREVAIKVLSPEVAASKVALQRFLQEARSIGRLNHPNVVSIYDIDQWNGQYYIVMELLAGGSLAEFVDGNGPLPWSEACRMIAQAALGLQAAHAAGMVHRDIKPENLMQTKDGLVKVVDFGLSKLVDAANDTRTAVTKQGQILGTPQYMSPEQFESVEVDSRTDIYSLGASLFRLATARFPYHECASIVQTMMAHLNKPAPKAVEVDPQIPEEFDRIVAKAMSKSAADRYQHAHHLADDLIALIQRHDPLSKRSVSPAVLGATSVSIVDLVPERIADEFTPLKFAIIVEPSKMMAAMMKDAVVRAGAIRVAVMVSKEQAFESMRTQTPDLLITAMQLPDGLGIDLIREISARLPLDQSCLILNSNDSTMEELIEASAGACRVLASKRARPDDVLRVVHAAGPIEIGQGPISASLDPMNLRLIVLTDLGKVPDALSELIRQVGLLDVAVLRKGNVASIPRDDVPTVVLRLQDKSALSTDNQKGFNQPVSLPDGRHLLAEIEIDSPFLTLQGLSRQGVTASVRRVLNTRQLTCLLQACRLS